MLSKRRKYIAHEKEEKKPNAIKVAVRYQVFAGRAGQVRR